MSRVFVADELAPDRRVVVKVLAAITTSPEQLIPYATCLREQGRLGGLLDRDVATVRAELESLERQSSGR
jgi:hypothetical protein